MNGLVIKISRDSDAHRHGLLGLPYLRKYTIEVSTSEGRLLRKDRFFGAIFKRRLAKKLHRIVGYEVARALIMLEAEKV